jgi:hypothetical protein
MGCACSLDIILAPKSVCSPSTNIGIGPWPPNSILVPALFDALHLVVVCGRVSGALRSTNLSHVPPLMILCWFVSNSSKR